MSSLFAYYLTKPVFKARIEQDSLRDQAEEIFNKADPTTNRKFTRWILSSFEKGYNHKLEDVKVWMSLSIKRFISLVFRKKLSAEQCDINYFHGLFGSPSKDGLLSVLEKFYTDYKLKIAEPTIVHQTDYTTIKEIKTLDEAIWAGRGTRWCTSREKGYNPFNSYIKDGPLYYIEAGGKRYQLHMPTCQFMNIHDKPYDGSDERMSADVIDFLISNKTLTKDNARCLIEKGYTVDTVNEKFFNQAVATVLGLKGTTYDHILCYYCLEDENYTPNMVIYTPEFINTFIEHGITGPRLLKIFPDTISFEVFKIMIDRGNVHKEEICEYFMKNFCNTANANNPGIAGFIEYADDKYMIPKFFIYAAKLEQHHIDKLIRTIGYNSCIEYIMKNLPAMSISIDDDYRILLAHNFPEVPFVAFMKAYHLHKLESGLLYIKDKFNYIENWEYPTSQYNHLIPTSHYNARAILESIKEGTVKEFVVKYPLKGGIKRIVEEYGKDKLLEAGLDDDFIEKRLLNESSLKIND